MHISVRVVLPAVGLLLLPAVVCGQADDFLGQTPEKWAKQLLDKEPGLRRSAAFALGRIGSRAEEALPKLLEIVQKDATPAVRATAAMAIGDIMLDFKEEAGKHWETYGPYLEKQLGKETDARARRGLLYALGSFGPAALPALPAVRSALADQSPVVRQNAAWALGRLGAAAGSEAVTDLCKLLEDASPVVRRDAANALGDIGLPTAQTAVEPMLELIDREGKKDGDAVVLKAALEKFVRLSAARFQLTDNSFASLLSEGVPEEIVSRLRPLKDKEFETKNQFLKELSKAIGANELARLQYLQYLVLKKALSDGNPRVAKRLYPHLKNDDIETARAAAFAIANMGGPSSRLALPVLCAALHDEEDGQLQELAAAALGHMGPAAEAAVEDLGKTLTSKAEMPVRRNCAVALSLIGPAAERAVPQLIKVLKREGGAELTVRRYAAEALYFIGSPGLDKAIPTVIEIIRADPEPQLRSMCMHVLLKVPDLNRHDARKVLIEVMDEKNPLSDVRVSYVAARVLARHLKDKTPEKVIQLLLDRLKTTDQTSVVYRGADTRVDGAGEERANQPSVTDKTGGDARLLAAEALGWVGAAANKPEIIKTLKELTKAKDQELAQEATEALRLIQR